MAVKPIPDGYHSVTPYLLVKGAAEALAFYAKALGARELFRMPMPDGNIGHAEIMIGNSHVMLADEMPSMNMLGPKSRGGATSSLMIYLPDVDPAFKRAIDAGGKVIRPLANQFYGDRSGTFEDPFGHCWTLATHVEDVAPEEMDKRMKEAAKQHGNG